jgi:hypothetical protein
VAPSTYKPKKRLLTPEQIVIVREMVAAGRPRDEIAAAAGVTPWVLTHRLKDQLDGLKLKGGRPKGQDSWVEPTGAEEEASASSVEKAPWVEARAAEIRAKWTPERWAKVIGKQKPFEFPKVEGGVDHFTGHAINP